MSLAFVLSYAALWALVVFQGLLIVGLAKAVHGLRGGSAVPPEPVPAHELTNQPVPSFESADVFGAPVASSDLAGRPAALLFVSPDCTTCAVTLKELDSLRRRVDGNLAVVCRSDSKRCLSLAHHYDLEVPVIADTDRRLSDLFKIAATPTAVLIDGKGRIDRYGHPMSGDDLENMLATAGAHPHGVSTPNGDRPSNPDDLRRLTVHRSPGVPGDHAG